MKLAFWRKDKHETRSSGTGYTAAIMAARESYIAGQSGIGELTGTVQSCVSLWENGLSIAEVKGTDLLSPSLLGILARSLALRGEAVFYITEVGLIPCSDWELSTKGGKPRAYRLSIPEVGGGTTMTALDAEVVHIRTGSDMAAFGSFFFRSQRWIRSLYGAGCGVVMSVTCVIKYPTRGSSYLTS